MKRNELEQAVIQQYFNYNPVDGKLYNKISRSMARAGNESASMRKEHRYRTLFFQGKFYTEHCVIWNLHYGNIPDGYSIDHINGNRSDNRLINLRCIPHRYNMQNQKLSKNKSYSRIPGVLYEARTNKYRVRLMVDGSYKSFGYFEDVKHAEDHCIQMRREYYPGNTL